LRSKLVLFLAIVFGLAAAALAFFYLNSAKESLDKTQYVQVVVAARDIPGNTVLQEAMLTLLKKPTVLKHIQEFTDTKDIIGKTLTVPVVAGQPILSSQVVAPGDVNKGLSYKIPVGLRAVSVGVDEVSGLSGLLQPGDRVDVLATISKDAETYTVLPLQDVVVLAVGQRIDANAALGEDAPAVASTVTLAVQYNDAKPLMMASLKGNIRLLLRNPVDHAKGYYGPYKMSDLIKGPANMPAGGAANGQN